MEYLSNSTMDVISAANSLIGVPFRFGGRDKSGVDCVGLVIVFYRLLGIDLSAVDVPCSSSLENPYTVDFCKAYPQIICDGIVRAQSIGLFRPVEDANRLQNGDILFAPPNTPVHLGIWISGKVLHIGRKRGRVTMGGKRFFCEFKAMRVL